MAFVLIRKCLTCKTCFYKQETNIIQTNSSLLSFFEATKAQAKTWCWHTTHCAEEHAVQAAVRHAGAGRWTKQHRDGSWKTALVVACKQIGCYTVMTLTQGGDDTTTWSVCTCWPEAVTTGASVCSCTAVTVPCVCRQGRTIQYNLRQVIIRKITLDLESTGALWFWHQLPVTLQERELTGDGQ